MVECCPYVSATLCSTGTLTIMNWLVCCQIRLQIWRTLRSCKFSPKLNTVLYSDILLEFLFKSGYITDCPYIICRHLSNNKLIGSISPKLVHIPRLTYLWVFLSSWFFYVYTFLALIWFWYCYVTMVCDRYLDNNNFIGRIPEGLYKHPFLKEL
jgi:hypothetical protein